MSKLSLKSLVLTLFAVFFFAGIVISCDDDGNKPDVLFPAELQNTIWMNDNKDMLIFKTNTVTVRGASRVYTLQSVVTVASITQLQFSVIPTYGISWNGTTITGVTLESFNSSLLDNWRKPTNAEIDEVYLYVENSKAWQYTDSNDPSITYIANFGYDNSIFGVALIKNDTKKTTIADYDITINNDNTFSYTNGSKVTITYSFNDDYSELTLSGFTGELSVFNATYQL